MSHLQEGEVVVFNTPYGWVGTVAQYDRTLPRGAMLVHPGPFLAVDQGQVDQVAQAGGSFDFAFHIVTKAIGEPDEPPYQRDATRTGWLYVRDVHTPHELHYPDTPSHGYKDEGFYDYSFPTLMHRVVETDSPDLARIIVDHDPEASTLDDVLVERPARAA